MYKKMALAVSYSLAFASSVFANTFPSSQIYLATELENGIKVKPITGAKGYHNQPLVTEDGIYFTQSVGDGDKSQMDLFFYDFNQASAENLTNSPVSEYSPTLYPHEAGLSSIVVEADGKQKLWFYPFDKSQTPKRIFDHIEPVGYHAWGKTEDLVMFILGEPHTLQYTDLTGHLPKVVAGDIGRSLAYNEKRELYSFTYQEDKQHWFATFSPKTQQVKQHFVMPQQVRDYTWIDSDTVAYAINNRIYTRNIEQPKQVSQWHNFTSYCDSQITRLSYKQGKMAFVCQKL
ncbi:hypothetical protein CWB73_02035 [Pseudoalteromonas phenolica]|uniref:Uncharacterized protein n=1 Tax=Pseudoalteromonas phenolica TaxID=161398 RepID=A0A5S3YZQ3_9GAMM|nr:hypothetical protein [Pseudoalteromonas phenolica]TMP83622.1 hypothetical protein CWB73_02035 [Pseudoalteromonas phenolica]